MAEQKGCSSCTDGCSKCDTDDRSVKEYLSDLRGNCNSCGSFGNTCDPIKDELKDINKARWGYSKYPIVPFYDDGDATLRFFRKMKELSTTHGAIIQSQSDYVLGGEWTVTGKKRKGFKQIARDKKEVKDPSEMIDWIEDLNPEMSGSHLLETAKGLFENYKTYGNAWLKVDLVESAGKKYVYIDSVDSEKVRYYATKPDQDKVVMISPMWTVAWLQNNPPTYIKAYPNFSEFRNGTKSTMIHLKNKVIGRDWYGAPDSLGSLFFQYLENQGGEYLVDAYANDFTMRAFFDIEGDPGNEDFKGAFQQAIDNTFTHKGRERKRIMFRVRGKDTKETKVTQFQDNKSHDFHCGILDKAEYQIIKSHNWHKILMGDIAAGRIGSRSDFPMIFRNKYKNVIRPHQNRLTGAINLAFEIADEYLDTDISSRCTLDLANDHEYLLNDLEDDNSGVSELVEETIQTMNDE